MSYPNSDQDQYGILYDIAFKELNTLYPELAETFTNEINSEGYLSSSEIVEQDRLFRLLLFFEFYLIKSFIFTKLKTKVREINRKLTDNEIKDVKFDYSGYQKNELSLSELSPLMNDENYKVLTNKFQSILGIFGLKDKYEAYKITSASKIGSRFEKYGLR